MCQGTSLFETLHNVDVNNYTVNDTNMLGLHKKLVAEKQAVLGEEKEAVSKRLGKIR